MNNTCSGTAKGVCRSQHKLDPAVGGQGTKTQGCIGRIGIHASEVPVQHSDLAVYLGIGNILRGRTKKDVHHNRNADHRSGSFPIFPVLY